MSVIGLMLDRYGKPLARLSDNNKADYASCNSFISERMNAIVYSVAAGSKVARGHRHTGK